MNNKRLNQNDWKLSRNKRNIHQMKSFFTFVLAVGLLFFAVGCNNNPQLEADLIEPQDTHYQQKITQLEGELKNLRDENAMLLARIKELLRREEKLAAQLRESKFVDEQQKKQIQTLSNAPIQRDQYKTRVDLLNMDIKRLKKRINELEQALLALDNTTTTEE